MIDHGSDEDEDEAYTSSALRRAPLVVSPKKPEAKVSPKATPTAAVKTSSAVRTCRPITKYVGRSRRRLLPHVSVLWTIYPVRLKPYQKFELFPTSISRDTCFI